VASPESAAERPTVPDPQAAPEQPDVELGLEFRYGWCTLRLRSGEQEVRLRATTLRDAFTDLLTAVDHLTAGSVCQSVIWGGEGQGAFIDMPLAHESEAGLVIHEMVDSNWLRPGVGRLPERGHRLFGANCDFSQLLAALSVEATRVRDEYADRANHMEHWGWDFPTTEYENLLMHRALRS
jgi:hypothetical protein